MSVTGVNSTTDTSQSSALTGAMKNLDRDAFLKLLVTELRNQDPMNPMEDRDFIAQLAQFSSLEQMQQLNGGITQMGVSSAATQAFAMIGHDVDFLDSGSDDLTSSGKIESVSFQDGSPILNIGKKSVAISDVIRVY